MQDLFDLFDEIGLPYFRQGSLSDDEYPATFFTFWNIDSPDDSFYDNESHRYIEHIQVCAYTNSATLIYSVMDNFIAQAKAHGFVVTSRAFDTAADKDNFFGRCVYIKKINNLQGA